MVQPYRYILTAVLLLFAGRAYAQQGSVTFSGTHMTAGKAIAEIQEQSSYVFAFGKRFDTSLPVCFTDRQMYVKDALALIAGQAGFRTMVHNNYIAIVPADEAALPALTKDRYRPGNPASLNAESAICAGGRYDTVRVVTIVPAEPVVRNYPASYSDRREAMSLLPSEASMPKMVVKANMLYGGALLTPNLGVEVATGRRQTFEFSGSYLWWGRESAPSDNHKQLTHWMLRPEYRWWACERFDGHFFGLHALYARYFVSGREIPMLFKKEYSYDGYALGAGATYGYHWAFAERFGLEFNIGVGYAYMRHDRGTCRNCDWQMSAKTKHYFGPTRAGISLLFLIR